MGTKGGYLFILTLQCVAFASSKLYIIEYITQKPRPQSGSAKMIGPNKLHFIL